MQQHIHRFWVLGCGYLWETVILLTVAVTSITQCLNTVFFLLVFPRLLLLLSLVHPESLIGSVYYCLYRSFVLGSLQATD